MAALVLIIPEVAIAAYWDGNKLYKALSSVSKDEARSATYEEMFDAFRGMGYVAGVVDTWNDSIFCIPTNVKRANYMRSPFCFCKLNLNSGI
jgi:hypothetical protein